MNYRLGLLVSGFWIGSAAVLQAAEISRLPAPAFPDASQTSVWNAPAQVLMTERFPEKEPEFGKTLSRMLKQSPEKLGLPMGVSLRADSVELVPEAVGITPMAFIHLTQTAEGTPVAGAEATIVMQWSPAGSPLRFTQGRLYPALKTLPEKAIASEDAERKVWAKLSAEITRFESTSGGVWIRWIEGRWRTVQLYGITPQALIAAVDGSGSVFVWPGRIVLPPTPDKTKAKTDKDKAP